jgi:hypothetical protein
MSNLELKKSYEYDADFGLTSKKYMAVAVFVSLSPLKARFDPLDQSCAVKIAFAIKGYRESM